MKNQYFRHLHSLNFLYIFIPLMILTFGVGVIHHFTPALAQTPPTDEEMNIILTQAESLFKAIKDHKHRETWSLLSRKSQKAIVADVHKHIKKAGGTATEEEIYADFSSGGELSRAYWNGYLSAFDPDLILSESIWQLGKRKKEYAEIIIQYKKGQNPATLQMFREDGVWKVGLEETFGPRKWLP